MVASEMYGGIQFLDGNFRNNYFLKIILHVEESQTTRYHSLTLTINTQILLTLFLIINANK